MRRARSAGFPILLPLLSLLLSLACYLELAGGPCLEQHRWDQSDMHFFDAWARGIAAGDWLTAGPRHPFHDWHERIAREWLAANPGLAEQIEAKAGAEAGAAARLLWQRWYGGERFHQEPLYPYLLAGLYRVLGADPRWMFLLQALAGALTVWLVHRVTERAFGAAAAALAGGMALLYGPLLFYQFVLLRCTWLVLAGLGLVWLADRARAGDTIGSCPRRWAGVGAAGAAATMLKTTLAPMLVGVGALVLLRGRRTPKAALRQVGWLAAGTLVALSPVAVRNLAMGVPPLQMSSVGAIGFVLGNAADVDPANVSGMVEAHAPRIMGETDGRFLPAARATLGTHAGVGSYLALLAGKLGTVFHGLEVPNNASFYYYGLHSRVLRSLPLGYPAVAALGLAGMILALRRWDRAALLYLLVLVHLAPLLAFYTLGRYRVPLAVGFLPFAGFALVQVWAWLTRGRGLQATGTAAAVLLGALWMGRALPGGQAGLRPADFYVAHLVHYSPREEMARGRGDWVEAAAVLEEALRYEPEPIRAYRTGDPAGGLAGSELVREYAAVHERYAEALRRSGRVAAAEVQARRADLLRRAAEGR